MPSFSELAALQIEKHGRDRYPSPEAQFIKLVEEVGELGKEINRDLTGVTDTDKIDHYIRLREDEFADVILALFNLAKKCDVDLKFAAVAKVNGDTRRFT